MVHHNMLRILIAISSIFLILNGCFLRSRTYTYYGGGDIFNVVIDSINAPEKSTQQKYFLLPGLKDVNLNDLQFREYVTYVDKALKNRGYVKTTSSDDAELIIFLSYGIGDPQNNVYSYVMPTWGQTGYSSSTTYGTVRSYGNSASFSGTTSYTPSYGITGYVPITRSYTTYSRYIIIDAVDALESRKTAKIVQAWQTNIASTGSSGDLRRAFPVMITAAMPLIASNTQGMISYEINEEDAAVLYVKGLTVPGSIGIDVKIEKGDYTIKDVMIGSPAANAGLQVDDKIVSIDTTFVNRNMSDEELHNLITGWPGDIVNIKIRRGADYKVYSIKRQDYR